VSAFYAVWHNCIRLPIRKVPLMSLMKHFPKDAPLVEDLDIDQVGIVEASLDVDASVASLERHLSALDTQAVYDALSQESGALSATAQYWKGYAHTAMVTLEADDGKSLWRKILETIKAFFAKIRDSFKAFWGKMTKAMPLFEAEAEKTKKLAKKLKDPKTKDFDTALYGALGKGSRGTDGKSFEADMRYLSRIVEEIVGKNREVLTAADDYIKTINAVSKTLPVITGNPIAKNVAALVAVHNYTYFSEKDQTFDIPKNASLVVQNTRVLPGGYVLGSSTPNPTAVRSYTTTASNIATMKQNDKFENIMTGFRALRMTTPNHDRSKTGSLPTLGKDDIMAVCDHVIDIARKFLEFNDGVPARDKRLKDIEKANDELGAGLDKHGDGLGVNQRVIVKDTVNFSKGISAVLVQFPMSVDTVALSVVTNALKYCKASVDNY